MKGGPMGPPEPEGPHRGHRSPGMSLRTAACAVGEEVQATPTRSVMGGFRQADRGCGDARFLPFSYTLKLWEYYGQALKGMGTCPSCPF